MDVGCEALGAGTSRSDRPLAAANGRKPHAGQPSGTVHVLDAVALESAMERWGDTVLRLATSRMGSIADAEDVFQTVFMRLLQSRERFTDDEHLKAWLLRVTINCCNDVHRSPWSKRRAELDDAVHLFYFEGYATDEIAQITGERSGTVRSHLHRARKALKINLGAHS